MNKIYAIIVGTLLSLLIAVCLGSYWIYNKQSKTINNLRVDLANKIIEVQTLELDKMIEKDLTDLKIKIISDTMLKLRDNQLQYNQIKNQLDKSVRDIDKNDVNTYSGIMIDSLWSGYHKLNN